MSLNISLLVYQEDIYAARVYPVDDTEKRSIVSWSYLSRRVFEDAKRSPRCLHRRRHFTRLPDRCTSAGIAILRGIASGISKTDCVGCCASDLWCNANLSEFYSPPPSAIARDLFRLLFSSFHRSRSLATRRRRRRGVRTEKRTK